MYIRQEDQMHIFEKSYKIVFFGIISTYSILINAILFLEIYDLFVDIYWIPL
ncbi:MAG: hypothetical protein P857_906 [Candidatus Xenolissoclinum pacificiensis L6]|uniref:Uncharacterized protein n=1 Tax=Candidatus Xenolissoclinum pacificiensis L6 TaxID=1401685 RepID=W2V0I1_9RICK|nr:MAG: hypothetical protein P857_906 [Candidatus Xenolissoclinum pacificiensis L6]